MRLVGVTPTPWKFETTNVLNMIKEARFIAAKASIDSISKGVNEIELLVAANNLRHAADELERSLIEMKYGVRR